MDALTVLVAALLVVGAISWIGYAVYAYIRDLQLIAQVTSLNRGERSERRAILSLLRAGINPRAVFHDMYFRKPDGSYTQTDLAVATKNGLIVFEIKDYSGWLFGRGKQRYWTQILNYGREKHRFYNPILQNAGHIAAIRQRLPRNPGVPIYSVILFYGNCELKDVLFDSPNTIVAYGSQISSVVAYLLDKPEASYGDKSEIMDVFTCAVKNGADPRIRESQISSARYYARNKPASSYRYGFSRRIFGGRFWW